MITGYGAPDLERAARRLGVDSYYEKPVDIRKIRRELESIGEKETSQALLAERRPVGNIPTLRVKVDEELCTGCGKCSDLSPEVFEIENGKARAKLAEIPNPLQDSCLDAMEECPVLAIEVCE